LGAALRLDPLEALALALELLRRGLRLLRGPGLLARAPRGLLLLQQEPARLLALAVGREPRLLHAPFVRDLAAERAVLDEHALLARRTPCVAPAVGDLAEPDRELELAARLDARRDRLARLPHRAGARHEAEAVEHADEPAVHRELAAARDPQELAPGRESEPGELLEELAARRRILAQELEVEAVDALEDLLEV